jgi:HSP20 family protein
MNAIIRWSPIRELADVHGSLSSILGPSPRSETSTEKAVLAEPDWVPLVDIAENDGGYLLKIEIPGVREDDVSVTLKNRYLTVTGELKTEVGEGVRYLRMERASGTFSRAFHLAETVDPDSVEARLSQGVLEIHVAKSDVAKPRVIPLKAQ